MDILLFLIGLYVAVLVIALIKSIYTSIKNYRWLRVRRWARDRLRFGGVYKPNGKAARR